MTTWNEFKVLAPSEIEEPLTDYLMELGSAGVSIQNKTDGEGIPNINGDTLWGVEESLLPDQEMIVTSYFSTDEDLTLLKKKVTKKINELEKIGFNVTPFSFDSNEIKDEDWENAWKKYYYPQRISRFMTIVPEWEEYTPAQENELCIRLDPGLAFGTGTHPTTILSLQGLETILRGNETVLDVGTGSGVLTIGSALLGASTIYAYDLDEIATSAAKTNISLNSLSASIFVQQNDLLKGLSHKADIIVANILAEIILKLIDDAWINLKEEGYFITSGIIHDKKDIVEHALLNKGFFIQSTLQMGDWVTFISQKPKK